MPIETTWYIEKRVLYQRCYGAITLEEFEQSVEEVGEFMAAGTSPVHAIANLLEVEKWPPMLEMSKTARRDPHTELGWTAIIVVSPVTKFIISVLIQFTKGKFRLVNTFEDAVQFLQEQDTSLKFIIPPYKPHS